MSFIALAEDQGQTIKVRVSFTDDAGNEESLTSTATAAVAAGGPTDPPGAPRNLTGTANSNGTVTLSWDAPNDDSVTGYQILRRRPREGEKILLVYVNNTGSTATEYTDSDVTPDVRHVYRVKAVNAAGLSSWSNFVRVTPTQPAEPAQNSVATGTPTISGTAQVGETLTADTSGIADADGLTGVSYGYQWIVTDGGADIDITSATDSSYTLADDPEGATVTLTLRGAHSDKFALASNGVVTFKESPDYEEDSNYVLREPLNNVIWVAYNSLWGLKGTQEPHMELFWCTQGRDRGPKSLQPGRGMDRSAV